MIAPLAGCELKTYRCGVCDAHGVRMFRSYQTFADFIVLRCQACALVDQKMDAPDNEDGSTIGWLVAAIPCPPCTFFIAGKHVPQGQSFWGFTSVPPEACAWWFALPITMQETS